MQVDPGSDEEGSEIDEPSTMVETSNVVSTIWISCCVCAVQVAWDLGLIIFFYCLSSSDSNFLFM